MNHDPLCVRLRAVMTEDHSPAFGCAWCHKIEMIRADETMNLQEKLDRAYFAGYERGRVDGASDRKWNG